MGTKAKAGNKLDVLRCFARLASQAGLNAGDAHVHGRTRDEVAWEVVARVLRSFVAYAAANGLQVQDAIPGLEPADGSRWELWELLDELSADDGSSIEL